MTTAETRQQLRAAFAGSSLSVPHGTRTEDIGVIADFAGLAAVRTLLLSMIGKSVSKKKAPSRLSVHGVTGPSWPFCQAATYPLGLDYRPEVWGRLE